MTNMLHISVATCLCLGLDEQVSAGVEESEMDFASLQQPWLLITDGQDWHVQNNVFNLQPLSHCYYDVGSGIPELFDRYVVCSCREWLLLAGIDLPDVLVNLLSGETIQLPFPDHAKFDFCIITSPPSDPACHIVYFSEEQNHLMICRPGDKEFTIQKWDYELFPFRGHTVVAGKLFLTIPNPKGPVLLVVVEFKESSYQFEVLEMGFPGIIISSVCGPSYLFEYSGELFIIFKMMRGENFFSSNVAGFIIFKADLFEKKWIPIKNLGRLAIFVGWETAHAQCAPVESGIAANSIYFLEQDMIDSYYIYNLEEGTIRMIPAFLSMKTNQDTELHWIMMPSSFPKAGQKFSNMVSELSCIGEQVPATGLEELKMDIVSLQQPWLLITDGKHWHLQNNVFNIGPLRHCYYDVGSEIPGLTGRYIACSCREWVLLTDSPDNSPDVLVNLLSKETIELPSYNFTYSFCILTSPPSDPACHIVFFNVEENDLIICQPGDKEYTIKKWDCEFFRFGRRTVVAGKLFLTPLRAPNRLVMVEFKECSYQFEEVEMVHDPREYFFDCEIQYESPVVYFFEYSGELFLVYKIMCGVYASGFKIFRADLLKKKWIRIWNLGRLALFIGYETAHAQCASVESGIAANSIYFLQNNDLNSYYVYNLEEGSIRMIPTFCSMKTTEDTKLQLDWIMMPCDTSFPRIQGDQESIGQDSEKENQTSGEVEKDEVKVSWNMVPPELLNLIRLRLFGRDRTWFHAVFPGVCKAWQQISIQDFSIPPLLFSIEECPSFSPLLMSQENGTSSYDSVPVFRFFDPIHRKLYRTRIPELKGADIHYSSDGWLLVSRNLSIFFFNPLTREKIELPKLPALYTTRLSFSSPPTCSNCLVVGMDGWGKRVYTLKHGDETWIQHELENRTEAGRQYVCNPVVLDGLHYFISDKRDMLVLNLKNAAEGHFLDCKSWSSKFEPTVTCPCCRDRGGEDCIVEIDKGPAIVNIKPDGGEISIFKWNGSKKDWELMEGGVEFGGKELFISRRSSFMEKIDDVGGLGNTIFLPMIDSDAKDGVFYSLATRLYHTFYYNGYSSEQPYYVDRFLDGIWVKSDRKIVGENNLRWFM